MASFDFRKLNSLFLKKLLGAGGVEIAEMCGVHDMYMRAKGALGAKEIEVAVGCCWRCRQVSDEIAAEAVTAPYAKGTAPVVGKGLLVAAGARHGEDARDAYQRGDDGLGVARLG